MVKEGNVINIYTPISDEVIGKLNIKDRLEISGKIFCGRDAALPRLVELIKRNGIESLGFNLQGGVIFHTAVSIAGIGPTTSSKIELEGNMPFLSRCGIKIHLGKGALSLETVEALKERGSIFAITPPVTALFNSKMTHRQVMAFEEEGMEAFFEVEVRSFPAIVAIAHGKTIF